MYNSTSSLAICPTTDGLITCLFASLTGACLSSEDRTVSVVCSLWRSACSTNPEQMFGDGTQRWIPSQFVSPESSGSFQSTQGMAGCPVTTCIRASVVCWAVGRCHPDHSCRGEGSSHSHPHTGPLPCQVVQMCSCCSVTWLCLTLQPRGLWHTRLPCPSLSPGVCSNSCLLNQCCHPTNSSSVAPFSSFSQFFPASGSFPRDMLV